MTRSGNHFFKGSTFPKDNDSAFLLDVDRRGVPGRERMRRFRDEDEVDLLIVGCGAGGAVLAQRLARAGWRIVVLDRGPFWDPDEDWVSDEEGSHHLYWTDKRIIGGEDPVELGKNNSGHGVGGSMIHYAGYTPRFHPSDFETRTRDGVGDDWPISYWELKSHYERVERELPVAGQHWPWGDPHSYPHAPHPIGGAAERAWAGARAHGVEMRVGPVAIANGVFGNRPHCIYRGFCLQGCKVNAKASPLVTHVPDALEHGVEIRADSMAVRIELDDASGRVAGVTYVEVKTGRERFQRAAAVAVCGYSIESPRLLLHSTSRRYPHGLANYARSGRPLRDGAGSAPGRGPLPRTAAHVQGATAGGLVRAFLRDRRSRAASHAASRSRRSARSRSAGPSTCWPTVTAAPRCASTCATTTTGRCSASLCELLPLPENRVTLADETRPVRDAGRPLRLHPVRERPAPTSPSPSRRCTTSGRRPARRTCSRSTATPTSSAAAAWASTRESSVVDSDHRVWEHPEPLRLRRQRDADAGQRQPGAHDHGARLAPGRAARRETRRASDRARRSRMTRDTDRRRRTDEQERQARGRRRHRRLGRRRARDRPRVRQPRRARRPAGARRSGPRGGARREVEALGGKALVLPTDVADHAQVEAAAEAVERAFGPIDVWVNDAMATVFAPFANVEPEEFKRATEVTYLGTVYGTMAALRRMVPRDHGTDRPGRLGARLPGDPAAVGLLRRQVRDPRLHRLGAHRADARPTAASGSRWCSCRR